MSQNKLNVLSDVQNFYWNLLGAQYIQCFYLNRNFFICLYANMLSETKSLNLSVSKLPTVCSLVLKAERLSDCWGRHVSFKMDTKWGHLTWVFNDNMLHDSPSKRLLWKVKCPEEKWAFKLDKVWCVIEI